MVQHVSEVEFNEVVLKYEGVVLVDFWGNMVWSLQNDSPCSRRSI